MAVSSDIAIEDLIETYPDAVSYLIQKGLPCVVCGEPFWGTLKELAEQNGWDEKKLAEFIEEFNQDHQ
jgi:hypothetical protein